MSWLIASLLMVPGTIAIWRIHEYNRKIDAMYAYKRREADDATQTL